MAKVKPYLSKLIYSNQTGFMHGRNIALNINKAIDLTQYVEDKDIDVK